MEARDKIWHPGMQVRLVHAPLRIGMITEMPPFSRRGRNVYQVRFPDKVDRIYEDQLEPAPTERMNPLDLLADGKLGTPDDLRRTLTHVRLTGRLADIIYSMEATNTDFYAYQFKPVLKLLQTPINGMLIADEVGLGKTIEAGLIWTELRSRFNFRRLVVLCPKALVEKWRDELSNKMGLFPQICDSRELLRTLQDQQAHARGFAIVASMHGLRPPRGWDDDEEEKTTEAAKLARYLLSMENEERLFDLLVVDEAHHMRNENSQTNKLGQLMRAVSEYLVLLTATPVHNRNRDLFSLLNLLDPDTFNRPEDLSEILLANRPLVSARDLVLSGAASEKELIEILGAAAENPLLQGNRQLEALRKSLTPKFMQSRAEKSRIAHQLETVNLLGHAVTRTRKRDVKEWRVVRDPQPEFIQMTDIERDFYNQVTDTVINYSLDKDINQTFLLAAPQRQMASCMPAALNSWRARHPDIDDYLLENNLEYGDKIGPLTEKIIEISNNFPDYEQLIKNDSKYERLISMLSSFFSIHPKDKVIIFSTFRGTLSYLEGRLNQDGISNIVLKGGGRISKDDIIKEFRSPNGPSVLLSSEVGGEGIDLQFSWVVVNYDLPWNPMRVEQRIGRVDRLGQGSDKVLIWNLFYADTIDARIYQKLYDKLDLCRSALGDFEAILGEQIRVLTYDLLTGRLTPEQQEARIDQTAQALETLKREESQLEEEASSLVAYGDYILQEIHAARDLNRWINGEDLYHYVTDFLNIHYPGYTLKEKDIKNYEFEFSLTAHAKQDLNDFIRENNLAGQTRLTQAVSTAVPCRFENRVLGGNASRIESISQFHPLVRFISERISQATTQLRPAVSVKINSSHVGGSISPGIYVLAVSLWSVQGLRDVEKLVYAAVDMAKPDAVLDDDKAELLASASAAHGELWLEAKNECDFDRAHQLANDVLFGTLDELFDRFVEHETAQNEDRADIQSRNLERHFQNSRTSLSDIIENLKLNSKSTSIIRATEGRLNALEERYRLKKIAIDSRRVVTSNPEDICISLISIT